MIIKKYSNTYKKCDRCKESNKEQLVFRVCLMIHFPYYDYFGFDLCEDCLKDFQSLTQNFLKETDKHTKNTKKNITIK